MIAYIATHERASGKDYAYKYLRDRRRNVQALNMYISVCMAPSFSFLQLTFTSIMTYF